MINTIFFLTGLLVIALAVRFAPAVYPRKVTAVLAGAGASAALVMLLLTQLYNGWVGIGASVLFIVTAALWISERFAAPAESQETASAAMTADANAYQETAATNNEQAENEKQKKLWAEKPTKQNYDAELQHEAWYESGRRSLLAVEEDEPEHQEPEQLPQRNQVAEQLLSDKHESKSASADDTSAENSSKGEIAEKRKVLMERLEEKSSRERD